MNKEQNLNEPQNQQLNIAGVINRFFNFLFPSFTKWKTLEVYYFDASWYVVQIRQNLNTGYKYFRCKKIIHFHYGTNIKNLSVEGIESVLND